MIVRTIRTATAVAASIAVSVAVCLAAPAPAHAATETTTPLPLPVAADVVAAADHVFVSGGANSTSIAVTDPSGTLVGTIDGLPGPTRMALDRDGRLLYVALPSADAIAVVDTATLKVYDRIPTGEGTCPGSLAVDGARLFFAYGCATGGATGNIGAVMLFRHVHYVQLGLLPTSTARQPRLVTVPDRWGLLIAAGDQLTSYIVTQAGAITPVDLTAESSVDWSPDDVAVSPDGSLVYTRTRGGAEARCTDDLDTVVRS